MAMDLRICPITPKFLSRSPNPSENVCRGFTAQNIADGRYLLDNSNTSAAHTGTTRASSAEKFRYRFIFNTGGTELRVLHDAPGKSSDTLNTNSDGDGVRHNRQTPHLEMGSDLS